MPSGLYCRVDQLDVLSVFLQLIVIAIMRVSSFRLAVTTSYVLILVAFVYHSIYLSQLVQLSKLSLAALESEKENLQEDFINLAGTRIKAQQLYSIQLPGLRQLTENSRQNFIRIKGITEKTGENLDEKVGNKIKIHSTYSSCGVQ